MAKVKRALIIPDVHIPYEDKRAVNLMLKVGRDVKPDEVVFIGDVADFYSVSSYGKDPSVYRLLKEEVAEVNGFLDRVDKAFPRAKKVFIEGNHEFRLQKYILQNASSLFGTIDCHNLFRLPHRKNYSFVRYTPNQGYNVLGSTLVARHEPIAGGEHVAASTVKKAGTSVIFGHTHRIQEFQTVTLGDEAHRGINCGWLGNKRHKVMNYVKNHHQWAQGFAVVEVLDKRHWFCHVVHIIDHMCSFGGRVYKS